MIAAMLRFIKSQLMLLLIFGIFMGRLFAKKERIATTHWVIQNNKRNIVVKFDCDKFDDALLFAESLARGIRAKEYYTLATLDGPVDKLGEVGQVPTGLDSSRLYINPMDWEDQIILYKGVSYGWK